MPSDRANIVRKNIASARDPGTGLAFEEAAISTSDLGCLFYVAATHASRAGIASFIAGCIASARDFSQLGARLEASGMTEIDPSLGPQFPVPSPERSRLWKSAPAGTQGDAFTGYIVKGQWKYVGTSVDREKAQQSPCPI